MKPIRIYRKFNNPSFPLEATSYPIRRIMESYVNIHWHPEPEMLYAQEGTYEIYSENGNFILNEGEICLIPTGRIHAIRSLAAYGTYWSIRFSMDLIQMPDNHFFQLSFVEPLKSGTLMIPDKFTTEQGLTSKAKEAILQIIEGNQNQQFIALLTFCLEILPACKTMSQKRDLQKSHDATRACIQYMDANYRSKITLAELAEHVHLHPNYLCAIFKRNSGQTIVEYLNILRVGKARNLLNKGKLSIAQVAEQVGFSDIDHFSRTFKQHYGISPSAFRKAYNEN